MKLQPRAISVRIVEQALRGLQGGLVAVDTCRH